MPKRAKKPGTGLFPIPVVLVTCADAAGRANIITLAWAGVVNSQPPMVSISIRPSRFSHKLVKETGQFVVNIPSAAQVEAVDLCGMVSGADVEKFKEAGFTAAPASVVRAPLIEECPVNIECVVRQSIPLGTHEMFIGEVVKLHYNEDALNARGAPDIAKIAPFAYCDGHYVKCGETIGDYGFSKKKRGET